MLHKCLWTSLQWFFSISYVLFLLGCSSESHDTAPPFPQSVVWLNRSNHFQLRMDDGKFILLEFLTSDCESCRPVSQSIQILQKRYNNTIDVIGIYSPNRLTTKSEVNRFITTLGISYPIIYDEQAKIFDAYHIDGWPTIILISPDRKIIMRLYGARSIEYLDQSIQDGMKRKIT